MGDTHYLDLNLAPAQGAPVDLHDPCSALEVRHRSGILCCHLAVVVDHSFRRHILDYRLVVVLAHKDLDLLYLRDLET